MIMTSAGRWSVRRQGGAQLHPGWSKRDFPRALLLCHLFIWNISKLKKRLSLHVLDLLFCPICTYTTPAGTWCVWLSPQVLQQPSPKDEDLPCTSSKPCSYEEVGFEQDLISILEWNYSLYTHLLSPLMCQTLPQVLGRMAVDKTDKSLPSRELTFQSRQEAADIINMYSIC